MSSGAIQKNSPSSSPHPSSIKLYGFRIGALCNLDLAILFKEKKLTRKKKESTQLYADLFINQALQQLRSTCGQSRVCRWDLKDKHEPVSTEENLFTARSWPCSFNREDGVAACCALLCVAVQWRGSHKEETSEWGVIYPGQKESASDPEQWAELDSSTQHSRAQLTRSLERARFFVCIFQRWKIFDLELNNVEKKHSIYHERVVLRPLFFLIYAHVPGAPAKPCACPRCVGKGRTNGGDPSVLGFTARLIAFALTWCQQ